MIKVHKKSCLSQTRKSTFKTDALCLRTEKKCQNQKSLHTHLRKEVFIWNLYIELDSENKYLYWFLCLLCLKTGLLTKLFKLKCRVTVTKSPPRHFKSSKSPLKGHSWPSWSSWWWSKGINILSEYYHDHKNSKKVWNLYFCVKKGVFAAFHPVWGIVRRQTTDHILIAYRVAL